MSNRGTRRPVAPPLVVLVALAALASPAVATPSGAEGEVDEPIADTMLESLQQERSAAGLAPFLRRADLDSVADERARLIAGLPHAERLRHAESIAEALRRHGILWFRNASLHLDMGRGYRRPAEGFLRSWARYESGWAKIRDPRYGAIGLATARADDGWIVLVAVFLEELEVPEDLPALERRVVEEVNRIRRERGLGTLAVDDRLSGVARHHSQAMADEGFVDHVDPTGRAPADRVSEAGIDFRAVAENIHVNRGAADPVQEAVDGWMGSRGHRKQILGRDFAVTGVGVVLDDEGVFYFTQLFLQPAR